MKLLLLQTLSWSPHQGSGWNQGQEWKLSQTPAQQPSPTQGDQEPLWDKANGWCQPEEVSSSFCSNTGSGWQLEGLKTGSGGGPESLGLRA
jgi:hypothetical protein